MNASARLILTVLVGAMSISFCCALGRARAASSDFVALENQLSAALAGYDATAISAIWDDDFVTVFPNGHLSHRAERLAALARPVPKGPGLISHNDSVDVQYEDAHVAVVTVRSTWRFGDVGPGDPYMATHVWIRRGETWRLLSAQVAQIKP